MSLVKTVSIVFLTVGVLMSNACAEEHKQNDAAKGEDETPEARINAKALHALIDTGVSMEIVDARDVASFEKAHIVGAMNLPPGLSKEEITEKLKDKEKLIITYCGGVRCPLSHLFAVRLKEMGYKNVIEYPEGMEGWVKNLGPVEGAVLDEYRNQKKH